MTRVSERGGPASFVQDAGAVSLLREQRRDGYPPEYLQSRIRGRRSKLTRNWPAAARGPSPVDHLASAQYQGFVKERTLDGMWPALLAEHRWVYGQMDGRTRREFAPYFLYVELRTICMCLRFLEGERTEQAVEVLEASLLSKRIAAFLREGEVTAAIASLERRLSRLSPRFRGLAERYAAKGLREVERELIKAFLGWALTLQRPPVVREFFRRLIDARNILALLSSLRRDGGDGPFFLEGGVIPPARLKDLLERGDPYNLIPLVRQTAGVALPEPDPTRIETALYRGVTKFLVKEGREPLGHGVLLDYLWRCSLEVTNLGLLFAGKDLEREDVLAQLVY